MSVYIVHHDCRLDTHDCRVIGPFPDRSTAVEFAEKYEDSLQIPLDGGYAFAAIIHDGMETDQTPEGYAAERAEAAAEI